MGKPAENHADTQKASRPYTSPTMLLRPLPRTVTPFPNETTQSYLNRLARANHLDGDHLRFYLTESRKKSSKVPADRLSVLSGIPEVTLLRALDDLHGEADPISATDAQPRRVALGRRPCQLCAAGREFGERIYCQGWQDVVICLLHRRWIGPGDIRYGHSQPDLTNQPDILQATKRYRRIVRRHGRVNAARAYAEASGICHQWRQSTTSDDAFIHRMQIFHGEEWSVPWDDVTVHAAIYPQVIALTRILVSPYWQSITLQEFPIPHRFVKEVQRTVNPLYNWDSPFHSRRHEPLIDWVNSQRNQMGKLKENYQTAANSVIPDTLRSG
ncbi:TniQ family protein [Streptosporangium sp. NPDC000563]|uniref:TniQ family protein n=1 Tax=Streptosporangium sp. NPDC000563 TaxID=3154366 RepID=UPI00332A2251